MVFCEKLPTIKFFVKNYLKNIVYLSKTTILTVIFNIDQHVICTWLHFQPQLTLSFPEISSIFNLHLQQNLLWMSMNSTCIPHPIDEQLSIQDHLFFFLIISSFTLTHFVLFSYLLIESFVILFSSPTS